MPRRISESAEDVCDVCSEGIAIFATGKCDHPVCLKCSTRLRALIDDMSCPICRTDLPKVVFTKARKLFDKILWQKFKFNRKHNIYFEDAAVEEIYKKLLEHQCKLCPDRPSERGFMHLKTHMSKEHSLYYCDLCVEHLKVFSGERRSYTRPDLARHRRLGDADDTSHRGHPLCEFCDERHLDNDELLRHLRREHYFCHFCDQDGSNQYYSDYDILREHFLDEHYLCEEEECARAQFTNAFKSAIDLKGHQAQHHYGGLCKAQKMQNRTLDIEINLAPRAHKSGRRERGVVTGGDYEEVSRGRGRGQRRPRREDDDNYDLNRGIAASLAENRPPEGGGAAAEPDPVKLDVDSKEDFPTIGASAGNVHAPSVGSATMANRFARGNKMSVKESADEDFPELSNNRELQQHAKKVPVHAHKIWRFDHKPKSKGGSSAKNQNAGKKKDPGMEFKVPKEAQIVERVEKEEDFPALPGSAKNNLERPVSARPQKPAPAPAKPVSKPDLPFKHPPLAAVAAKPANASKPTLSSIGNLLTSSEPRSSAPAVGKPKSYFSGGNTPNLISDSDFPTLGGGYQAAQVDSWIVNAKEPVEPAPNVNLIKSKVQDIPQPARSMPRSMQTSQVTAFSADDDFPTLGGGSSQAPAMWVTKGQPSNRIKEKPLVFKQTVSNANQKPKSKSAKSQKKETPPPSNLDGLLSTSGSSAPVKPPPNQPNDDDEFITVIGKPKKKSEPEVTMEGKGKKKKKKKKGKTGKDEKEEEGKENADDLVIGYALAALEEAEKKAAEPEEPEIIPDADFRMGGQEKTKSKYKPKRDKKPAEKVTNVPTPRDAPQDSWIEVKREPEVQRDSRMDHVKVISNKNLSNVEKLAHMNNFSLLEEVEDVPIPEEEVTSKGKKNSKVPDLNLDEFPALGGISKRSNSWMEGPRDYSSGKPQRGVRETSPLKGTTTTANVSSAKIPELQSADFPSLESTGIAKHPSAPLPVSPPVISPPESKPFKPPPGFVSGGSLSAIASSIGGTAIPKSTPAPAPVKPPKMTYLYSEPPVFQERNQKLISEFYNLLSSQDEFDQFKYLSGQFRQGLSSAQDYYTDCVALMGTDRFMVVFPELLVLLPDIEKQKELHDAFRSCKKNSYMKKQELHLQKCSTCHQVLTHKDLGYHVCNPDDGEEDFPSLD